MHMGDTVVLNSSKDEPPILTAMDIADGRSPRRVSTRIAAGGEITGIYGFHGLRPG